MHFGGVALLVDDVDATVAFYEAAFGLGQVFADGDGTFVVLGRPGWSDGPSAPYLSVEHRRKIEDYAEPRPTDGFRVLLETDDVDDAYRRAVEAGARSALVPTTRPWGQRVAAVIDLNDAIVEINGPVTPD
ncbi:VOC family protein [Nocardia brasiliensis]|uniref:VOC family protein n=1 Tax=Nocardia brasiliensis TaxID=37326 RepID=UPI0004A71106|nr:VOC family protein [Nocardia brasiliensis]MBF6125902.1 VOC family protein [Nocardia brasiliensis]